MTPREAAERLREAEAELASLREDGPDGIDDRAREEWQQSIREKEDDIAALRRNAGE